MSGLFPEDFSCGVVETYFAAHHAGYEVVDFHGFAGFDIDTWCSQEVVVVE
jgi:hypothetical protein